MKKYSRKLTPLFVLLLVGSITIFQIFSGIPKRNNEINIKFNDEEVDKFLIYTSSSANDFLYKWNRTWGGAYDDYIDSDNSMAIDSFNNVYITGKIDITGSSNYDVIVIKCDSQGVEQWVRYWDGGASDEGNSILIDSSNEIYVVGMTTSYADLDGDMVIIKYDINGNQQWNFTWGKSELDRARAIVKDSYNNYYIAGETQSFGDIDGDAIVVKFDNSWVEQWNVTWGGSDRDYANAMEIDKSGNICVVGGSYSSDPSSGEADVMILKYDDTGTLLWDRDWGTTWTQRGPAIAIDSSNNIYFVGHTFGNPASSMKGHLVKYDTNGNYQWERIWGVNGVYGNSWGGLIIDSNDEIFISGLTTTHGPYTGGEDVILLSYDTSGNQNWYKTWGMPDNERAICLLMDSQRNLFLAGWMNSLGAGGLDIFLMKYENIIGPDLIAPVITINQPVFGTVFVDFSPLYSITIDETNLNSFWYSLDNGQTNYSLSELTGAIDQNVWDSIPDGHVTLTFYAQDEAGNVGQSSVLITKFTTRSRLPGIPGYNIIAFAGVGCLITIVFIKKTSNKTKK
ncbi:MAG: SBBP repeat-containing protein [Promethearchaeota archaeon]